MLSYEALYSSKIQKMMSLYYIVENFFVLKKYNPIHQPRNLVMLYKRVRVVKINGATQRKNANWVSEESYEKIRCCKIYPYSLNGSFPAICLAGFFHLSASTRGFV